MTDQLSNRRFNQSRDLILESAKKYQRPSKSIFGFWSQIGCVFAFLSVAILSSGKAEASEFFVEPGGSSSGDGSSGKPWDLQTALNQPGSVKPGDTLWLRGGTYRGSFQSRLTGAQNNLITVKQYPGERAIIDGKGSSDNTLTVTGSWACYWGFEVMNSDTSRPNVQWTRPHGVTVQGPNTKFINLIVHDCGQGFGAWMEAPDAEIYGCIIYNNGNSKFDHGIYTQNSSGTKHIVDNLIFNNFGYGLHIYGSDGAYLLGYDVQGNSIFNNGSISKTDAQNIIIGGGNPAERISLVDNCTYSGFLNGSVTIGSDSLNKDLVLQNNYFADYTSIEGWESMTVTGNTFVAPSTLLELVTPRNFSSSLYRWEDNAYFSQELAWKPFVLSISSSLSLDFSGWRNAVGFDSSSYAKGHPTDTKVFIRPNRYEPGRGHITVYNWNNLKTVSVDLSSFLPAGTAYEIRNAQDYLGNPVVSGVYRGGEVVLPMNGLSVAQPYGLDTPAATGPTFNAFVVVPRSNVSSAPSSGGSLSNTPKPPTNPSSGDKVYLRMEAESGTIISPMALASDGSALNGQFIVGNGVSGTALYTVNIANAGDYVIWGRVLAMDGSDRGSHDSFFVAMDGIEDIYDVAEGKWADQWQWTVVNGREGTTVPLTSNPRKFALKAGTHILTVRGRESGTMLDSILITNDLDFVPSP